MLYWYRYQEYPGLSTEPEELTTFKFRLIGCNIMFFVIFNSKNQWGFANIILII